MRRPFELEGRTAVVVTMHGKERVIEPALAALGLRFLPRPPLNTDRFGTFTRDVVRQGSQREALLAKAQAGLELVPEADFALASEGAFGPHPQIPFVSSGLEMVALVERSSRRSVIGRHLTPATNFARGEARSMAEVDRFADRAGFPTHALVVLGAADGPVLAKGVTSREALGSICAERILTHGAVSLETDMRAHLNPTRMEAIAQAVQDLARRLQARCPACGWPDWVPEMRAGRPCGWCGEPTGEAWIERFRCEGCGHEAERRIEPERKAAPAHCMECNP